MIVYSTTITNRLRYICDFIGKEVMGKPFILTDQKAAYKDFQGPRINYTTEKIADNDFWLEPHSILFEKGISQQSITFFEANEHSYFFKTSGEFPFDIFAATFYLLSRYEEYLPHQKDMYGRYGHENSLAFKNGFLGTPLVNKWLDNFKNYLQQKFPGFIPQRSTFQLQLTYDIDEAYSYKYKEWWRSAGAAIKDLLKGKWNNFSLRRKVLDNEEPDPFDSYDWIDNLHRPTKIKPHYFFLVSERTGKYDKNILPKETALQTLIKRHADKYEIGIHPSWQSGDEPSLLNNEIKTLEHISRAKITSSRYHFIRFTLPQSFRLLIDAGIKEDFSMGYGSINGFRASVASAFYWYDLEKEETTNLLLYPFCYMEANSFFEQKFSPEQALKEMRDYYQEVKKVNGIFISIWHNTFLGTDKRFEGWREIYYQLIQEVKSQTETVRPD